jgi:putative redox protein
MILVERIAGDATAQRITIRGHELVADISVAEGGADAGPDPHDLYDAALGACKALTILWYAQRKGIAVGDVSVAISRDAGAERDGVYKLTARVAVTGDFDDATHAKLIDVADKCPVHKLMTQVETQVTTIAVPHGAQAGEG